MAETSPQLKLESYLFQLKGHICLENMNMAFLFWLWFVVIIFVLVVAVIAIVFVVLVVLVLPFLCSFHIPSHQQPQNKQTPTCRRIPPMAAPTAAMQKSATKATSPRNSRCFGPNCFLGVQNLPLKKNEGKWRAGLIDLIGGWLNSL